MFWFILLFALKNCNPDENCVFEAGCRAHRKLLFYPDHCYYVTSYQLGGGLEEEQLLPLRLVKPASFFHMASEHIHRKGLSVLLHIHQLIDTHSLSKSLWLKGERAKEYGQFYSLCTQMAVASLGFETPTIELIFFCCTTQGPERLYSSWPGNEYTTCPYVWRHQTIPPICGTNSNCCHKVWNIL